MHRNQVGAKWWEKSLVFLIACLVGAMSSGIVIGFFGSQLAARVRIALALVLCVAGIILAALQIMGVRLRLPQRDCETTQRWVHLGALRWATINGLSLGCGAFTRIGFWIWYAIPFSALISGSPCIGCIIYGVYGFIRGVMPLMLILGTGHKSTDIGNTLLSFRRSAERLTTFLLGLLCVIGVLTIGF